MPKSVPPEQPANEPPMEGSAAHSSRPANTAQSSATTGVSHSETNGTKGTDAAKETNKTDKAVANKTSTSEDTTAQPKKSLGQRIRGNLLWQIIIAIIAGIVCSLFFPDWLARVFVTYNSLFSNFLSFFIPVLIFALITPAISGLGRGAGKWLAITTGVAYGSTIFSGLIAFGTASIVYPWLLKGDDLFKAKTVGDGALKPFFEVEMKPPFEVMTGLLLAFTIGVAMTAVKSDTLYAGAKDLERVIMRVISKFVIPLLPPFIFGMFLSMGMNGNLTNTLVSFAKVIVLAILMTVILLVLQFSVTGGIAKVNPWRAFKNMVPAYLTALGHVRVLEKEWGRSDGRRFHGAVVRDDSPGRVDDEDFAVRVRDCADGGHRHDAGEDDRLRTDAGHHDDRRAGRAGWCDYGGVGVALVDAGLFRFRGCDHDRGVYRDRLVWHGVQRYWRRCHRSDYQPHGGG